MIGRQYLGGTMPRFCSKVLLSTYLLCASICFAQQDTGIITGVITDPSGSPIPNAAVVLLNTGTNASMTVNTASKGLFVATPLRIGVYTISVEVSGFNKMGV